MKLPTFMFLIVDLSDGTVKGTDDEVVAAQFAACDEYVLIEPAVSCWFSQDMTKNKIKLVTP